MQCLSGHTCSTLAATRLQHAWQRSANSVCPQACCLRINRPRETAIPPLWRACELPAALLACCTGLTRLELSVCTLLGKGVLDVGALPPDITRLQVLPPSSVAAWVVEDLTI